MTSICVSVPGNHMVFDSITYTDREQSKKKNQTQYGISWNPEYDATNNCSNSDMSLSHQSVPVDEKCETKRKNTLGTETLPFVPSLIENGEIY